ncbi:MAG: TIR domain-containing protein [Pseudomonadota bacterium]
MLTDARIFLAHASEDKPAVIGLYKKLKAKGYAPWLDAEDLLPGQNWRDEIRRALREAAICLACLSKHSIQKRGYVQREFKLALSICGDLPPGDIYLIPVRLDECDIPDLRISELDLNLRDLQWVNLFDDDGFERLEKAIEAKLTSEGAGIAMGVTSTRPGPEAASAAPESIGKWPGGRTRTDQRNGLPAYVQDFIDQRSVLAYWPEDGHWYPAVIHRVTESGKLRIQFHDGFVGDRSFDDIIQIPDVDSYIECQYETNVEYFPARIIEKDGDMLFVEYLAFDKNDYDETDGQPQLGEKAWADIVRIRLIGEPSASPD